MTFRVKLYKFDRATNTKALARSVPYEGFSEEWVRENMGPGVWRCELMSGSSTHRGIQRVTEIAIADTSSPSPRANAWPVAPAAPQLQGFQPAPVTGGEVSPLMLMMSMLNQQATMMQSIVSASLNKTDNVTPLLQTAVAAVGPLLGNLFNRPATPVGELMQLLDVVGDRGAAPAPKPEGMLSQIIGALAQHAPQILERVAAAAATGQTQPGSTASIVPPASLPASQNAPGGPSPAHGSAQRGAESPAQTLAGTPSSAGEGAADQGEASPGSHKGVEVPP
ncbi:MAG: hypothetical protein SFY95_04905, partial [Planctomycetota bacterium]|nr:hypothetical protein [Planctomycetota bacterium]